MLDLLEEIETTKKEVEKDELNFNFNGKLETKEEVKPNVSGIENVDLTKNVKVILFLINNDSFKSKEKSYNLTVCGKPMKDWVKNAVKDIAADLVKLYAERTSKPGYRYLPDSVWQKQFEDEFEYNPTIDQITSIEDIKKEITVLLIIIFMKHSKNY